MQAMSIIIWGKKATDFKTITQGSFYGNLLLFLKVLFVIFKILLSE
jgi:hypothetical protein